MNSIADWLSILGVGLVVFFFFRNYLTRRSRSALDVERLNGAIGDVSVEEAKKKVEKFLREPGQNQFTIAKEIGAQTDLSGLGPITREFFLKYPRIESNIGGLVISSEQIGPSEYIQGFLSIGHIEDWDVVQKWGADVVYVVEGSEADVGDLAAYPSIYNLLLVEIENRK